RSFRCCRIDSSTTPSVSPNRRRSTGVATTSSRRTGGFWPTSWRSSLPPRPPDKPLSLRGGADAASIQGLKTPVWKGQASYGRNNLPVRSASASVGRLLCPAGCFQHSVPWGVSIPGLSAPESLHGEARLESPSPCEGEGRGEVACAAFN